MKILIAGVNGYLGSHLARALVGEGFEVLGLEQSSSQLERIQDLMGKIELLFVDQVDVSTFLQAKGVQGIIYAATNYNRGPSNIGALIRANIEMPASLLVAALPTVKFFINCDTILPPETNVYALSKFQFRQWAEALVAESAMGFWNLSLDQFYGPGESPIQFPTRMLMACMSHETIPLTGGEQRRDFTFITDVVSGFVRLVQHLRDNPAGGCHALGVGTGVPVTLRTFVETVKTVTASQSLLEFGRIPYRPGELELNGVDISYMTSLGWSARTTLSAGLAMMRDHLKQ